jgi:hypothetical protein
MNNIFINEVTGELASAGSFGPSQINMLTRVFDKACEDLRIPYSDTAHRDTLATVILSAAKDNPEESGVFFKAMLAMKSRFI